MTPCPKQLLLPATVAALALAGSSPAFAAEVDAQAQPLTVQASEEPELPIEEGVEEGKEAPGENNDEVEAEEPDEPVVPLPVEPTPEPEEPVIPLPVDPEPEPEEPVVPLPVEPTPEPEEPVETEPAPAPLPVAPIEVAPAEPTYPAEEPAPVVVVIPTEPVAQAPVFIQEASQSTTYLTTEGASVESTQQAQAPEEVVVAAGNTQQSTSSEPAQQQRAEDIRFRTGNAGYAQQKQDDSADSLKAAANGAGVAALLIAGVQYLRSRHEAKAIKQTN